nr:GNAT family N-acetyltransferase [Actibacterium lipolyticum]
MLRDVVHADIPALIAIMAPVIRDTTASFSDEERDEAGWKAMIAARHAAGRAFLVAEADGVVLGYGTYDQFRSNNGYRLTMEHSIYLSPEAQGRGLGRKLMVALEDHARAAGVHSMFGGIDADNASSIAFHEAVGYAQVARLPQVGFKFDRWLDLVLMQKIL